MTPPSSAVGTWGWRRLQALPRSHFVILVVGGEEGEGGDKMYKRSENGRFQLTGRSEIT